tara:strand:+ start:358 stop:627 length:270 start_codon:yes stop_codon:yes gene_type:complete
MFSRYLKDNALEDMKTELRLLETISDKTNQLVKIEMKKLAADQHRTSWTDSTRTRVSKMININTDMLRDVKMLRDFIVLTEKLSESEVA